MIECMRLIIGEVGTREREREGLKIGRSERSRTIWAAVKGPQCWGRNGGCSFAADTTHCDHPCIDNPHRGRNQESPPVDVEVGAIAVPTRQLVER